jgi:hypothetical protein
MTKELGPLSYGEKDEAIFLGREINRHRDYSEKTAETIDTLMQAIVEEQYSRAITMLTEHREEMDRLANALLEYEMLDRDDIDKVIQGQIIESPKKTRTLIRPLPEAGTIAPPSTEAQTASLPVTQSPSSDGIDTEQPKEGSGQ